MNGCVHVELGVDLDEYLDILSDSFPYGGDAILGELRLLWGDRVVVVMSEGVELHGRVAHFDHAQRFFRILLRGPRVSVPAVRIDANLIPDQGACTQGLREPYP